MSLEHSSPAAPPANNGKGRRIALALLPLATFLGLAGVFLVSIFGEDPSNLPSTMLGKPAPVFKLAAVDKLLVADQAIPGLETADLKTGKVTIVNFWASWCVPCHAEHPMLDVLKQKAGIVLVGVNYKDDPADARRFLGANGNPYLKIGADVNGRTAIDWGVYGVPETFVVDGTGKITYKHLGPITEESLASRLLPAIEAARKAQAK